MKPLVLLFSCLMAFGLLSSAGENDSLEAIAKAGTQDTGTVNALNLLCKKNWSSEEEKALAYGNRAIRLAEKINYKKGIAQALNNIGVVYYNFSDYNKALENHFKSLAMRKELGDKKDISASLNNIGNAYDGLSDYPHALDFFTQALKMREETGDKKGIAGSSNNIGNLYYSRGNYYKALEYFFEALKIYEEQGESSVAHANALHNIGNVYKEQNDSKNAIEFYEKGLKMREEIEDEQGIGVSYNAIAALYLSSAVEQKNSTYAENDYTKAREYFKKAIEIQEKIDDKTNMAISLNNLGIIYFNENDYDKALENSFASLKIADEIGDKSTSTAALGSIADIYRKQNKIDASIEFATRALAMADSLRILDNIKTSHLTLSENYDSMKQFDKSLFHYKQYIAYRDSLLNSESAKQISNMQQKYELEREKLEEEHTKEKEEADFERKEQAQYLIIFAIIIIVIVFVVIASHLQLSPKTIDFSSFVGVLLLFQFLEVLLHPYINKYTHGLPIVFILVNIVLASGLKPLHHQIEKRLIKVAHGITLKQKIRTEKLAEAERKRLEQVRISEQENKSEEIN